MTSLSPGAFMKIVGFTGTSMGMTPEQKAQVKELLAKYKAEGATHFRHGLCIGADEQAAVIAKGLKYYVIAHPGFNPRKPANTLFRSEFAKNDETLPEKPFILRDHDIVDEAEHMIAAPLTKEEQVRSGTWTTVRYARKKRKSMDIVYPDGTVKRTRA